MFSNSRGIEKCWTECLRAVPYLDSYTKIEKEAKQKKSIETVKKRQDLKSLAWEVTFHAVFLTLLIVTAFDSRDQRAYGYSDAAIQPINPNDTVSKISKPEEIWTWLNDHLMPFLHPSRDWDETPLDEKSRLIGTMTSYRLGPTRLRQHRAVPNHCDTCSQLRSMELRCVPSWSSGHRDWASYEPDWNGTARAYHADVKTRSPWSYSSWADVGGTPVVGRLGVYPSGGYVADLSGTLANIKEKLATLHKLQWVDQWTKVVFVETTIYNPNANMFAMITALFEFPQAGVIQPKLYTHPFRLFTYMGDYPLSFKIFDFLLYLTAAWFAGRVLLKLKDFRCAFFRKFWNLLELLNLLLTSAAVILYVGRQVVGDSVAKEMGHEEGQYYNFQTLAMWDELFTILAGFACCLSTLWVLHLCRFNRRLSLLGATMSRAAEELWAFAIFYGAVMAAFASFSYMMFGSWLYDYSTIMGTIQALTLVALGELQYENLLSANRIFAPTLIVLYMSLLVFLLINVLVSILMDSFAIARDALKTQSNDLELIDYMVDTVKRVLTSVTPFRYVYSGLCKAGLASHKKPDVGGAGLPGTKVATHTEAGQEPTKSTVHFTKKAQGGRLLRRKKQRKIYAESSVAEAIVDKNLSDLDYRLDLIDHRLDNLWSALAGTEFGPAPDVETISIWRTVEVTVADVIAEHLGTGEESDSSSLSNISVDSESENERRVGKPTEIDGMARSTDTRVWEESEVFHKPESSRLFHHDFDVLSRMEEGVKSPERTKIIYESLGPPRVAITLTTETPMKKLPREHSQPTETTRGLLDPRRSAQLGVHGIWTTPRQQRQPNEERKDLLYPRQSVQIGMYDNLLNTSAYRSSPSFQPAAYLAAASVFRRRRDEQRHSGETQLDLRPQRLTDMLHESMLEQRRQSRDMLNESMLEQRLSRHMNERVWQRLEVSNSIAVHRQRGEVSGDLDEYKIEIETVGDLDENKTRRKMSESLAEERQDSEKVERTDEEVLPNNLVKDMDEQRQSSETDNDVRENSQQHEMNPREQRSAETNPNMKESRESITHLSEPIYALKTVTPIRSVPKSMEKLLVHYHQGLRPSSSLDSPPWTPISLGRLDSLVEQGSPPKGELPSSARRPNIGLHFLDNFIDSGMGTGELDSDEEASLSPAQVVPSSTNATPAVRYASRAPVFSPPTPVPEIGSVLKPIHDGLMSCSTPMFEYEETPRGCPIHKPFRLPRFQIEDESSPVCSPYLRSTPRPRIRPTLEPTSFEQLHSVGISPYASFELTPRRGCERLDASAYGALVVAKRIGGSRQRRGRVWSIDSLMEG